MSRRQLLETLKGLLLSPEVVVSLGLLKLEHGTIDYDNDKDTGEPTNVKIVIDKRNAPVVSTVIHELLHLYMAKYHDVKRLFTEPLEEAMVKGLSDDLEDYLHDVKNKRLFQSWVKMVEAKLK